MDKNRSKIRLKMVFKYQFSVSGDNFMPEKVINLIQGDFILVSYFGPADKVPEKGSETYGFGDMSFWHPRKFSTETCIAAYEKDFCHFIEKNYQLFVDYGGLDFQIFMEIYFDGGQCNFEIFEKTLLQTLAKHSVALPISVYILAEEAIMKWEREIEQAWDDVITDLS